MVRKVNFLDLFAGAGGLSEGFIQAGYNPIAHVEADASACFTLRTRHVYHWLKNNNDITPYYDYLSNKICRNELYSKIPSQVLDSVIHETISKNSIKSIFSRIDLLLNGEKLDLIIGGPPCQAYSLIGRAQGNMVNDSRNYLFTYYIEFLKRYKPKFFVFENVLGLLSAKNINNESYFNIMLKAFENAGYKVEFDILDSSDYGVLQSRKRVILVGKRGKRSSNFYPKIALIEKKYTVNEIFADLPPINAGEGIIGPTFPIPYSGQWLYEAGIKDDLPITWHQARPHSKQDLQIYKIAVDTWNKDRRRIHYGELPKALQTHKNLKSFTDRFKVVASDLNSTHTLVAHIAKDGHHYIHPDIVQNRSITPREAARIQTFPDSYYFESSNGKPARTNAFKQIGNAVPVLLAKKIAEQLKGNFI